MKRKTPLFLLVVICAFFMQCTYFQTYSKPFQFATIGDYGCDCNKQREVADLIDSWNVDFIITLGDNNYEHGEAETIDDNVGKYFSKYIKNYKGKYGKGSDVRRFFPCLGNHDFNDGTVSVHQDYFNLFKKERYYQFVWGNTHFFALNTYTKHAPRGDKVDSWQAAWLKKWLKRSPYKFKVVYMHYSPYSSGYKKGQVLDKYGSSKRHQWPFKEWGADVVFSAHNHSYERIIVDGFPYFVNGLGGKSIHDFKKPIKGSESRYNDNFGAQRVTVFHDRMLIEFISIENEIIDSYTIFK